ncbi:MAG TPA: hypothetical protein VF341_11785 [Anaeromyxobacteraceae bacterium]
MSDGQSRSKPKPRGTGGVRTIEALADRRDVTKKKVIERLKTLSPSLLASGALADARRSSLEPPPPRRPRRFLRKK